MYTFLAIIPARLSGDACSFVVRWWKGCQVVLTLAALVLVKTYCNNVTIFHRQDFESALLFTLFLPDLSTYGSLKDSFTGRTGLPRGLLCRHFGLQSVGL